MTAYDPDVETVACGLCGTATTMTATARCDRCWELEHRIHADRDLARRILGPLTFTIEEVELYEFRSSPHASEHFSKTAYFCAAFYAETAPDTNDAGYHPMVFCYFNLGLGLEHEDSLSVTRWGQRWGWWTGNSASRVGTWPLRNGTPEQQRRREFHEGIGVLVGKALRDGEARVLEHFAAGYFPFDFTLRARVDGGALQLARNLAAGGS